MNENYANGEKMTKNNPKLKYSISIYTIIVMFILLINFIVGFVFMTKYLDRYKFTIKSSYENGKIYGEMYTYYFNSMNIFKKLYIIGTLFLCVYILVIILVSSIMVYQVKTNMNTYKVTIMLICLNSIWLVLFSLNLVMQFFYNKNLYIPEIGNRPDMPLYLSSVYIYLYLIAPTIILPCIEIASYKKLKNSNCLL